MLPRALRLTFKKDFDKVKKEGVLFQGGSFALSFLARGDTEPSRFGFIVSTKISKKAVIRNRIKRLFREEINKRLNKIKTGNDLVFLVKTKALSEPAKEISGDIEKVLLKTGLLK